MTPQEAIAPAIETVRRALAAFPTSYPDDTTLDGRYLPRPAADGFAAGANRGWTTGFWPGMQWLAWEVTGEAAFRDAGLWHVADLARRLDADEDVDMHDLGFLATLTAVAPWRLVGDRDARGTALAAADRLMGRFLEPAGVFQAWGATGDAHEGGRAIIDSLMNMPLLTWASAETGDPRYADAVGRHTRQLRDHIVRDDGSTFHTFHWDPLTGRPLRGATAQGAHDGSCWARGQAWGVYGFAVNGLALGDDTLTDAARRCARLFLSRLPADDVPYWDLVYGDGSGQPRDSSAGAIAACGLLVLADAETDPARADEDRAAADRLLRALIARCTPARPQDADALLLHGVYDLPGGIGVDEGSLWGDYFYLEALVRTTRPGWRPYW